MSLGFLAKPKLRRSFGSGESGFLDLYVPRLTRGAGESGFWPPFEKGRMKDQKTPMHSQKREYLAPKGPKNPDSPSFKRSEGPLKNSEIFDFRISPLFS